MARRTSRGKANQGKAKARREGRREGAAAGAPARKSARRPPSEDLDRLVLSDLEQVRVLATPLRMRILEALSEERTTAQLAELLGEKATRLYYHVRELARVGLVRRTRSHPKRGTVEKYYRAVARVYEADARLFLTGEAAQHAEALRSVAGSVLERTADELRNLLASGGENLREDEALVGFLEVRAGEGDIGRLRGRIAALMESAEKGGAPRPAKGGQRRYRLTLAFFPLDRGNESSGR